MSVSNIRHYTYIMVMAFIYTYFIPLHKRKHRFLVNISEIIAPEENTHQNAATWEPSPRSFVDVLWHLNSKSKVPQLGNKMMINKDVQATQN